MQALKVHCCALLNSHISLGPKKRFRQTLKRLAFVGLCIGLLAAAAVASTSSVSALLPLAVKAVRIAFRIGLHVGTVANGLYQRTSSHASWLYLVSGVSESSVRLALDEFHHVKATPALKCAYISAKSANAVTLSGPPCTLKTLLETEPLKSANRLDLPIHGPYHAPHLHGKVDLASILQLNDPDTSKLFDSYQPRIPILSTSTGRWIEAESTAQLLSSSFTTALKAETTAQLFLDENRAWMSHMPLHGLKDTGCVTTSKIAIVGMAGRFPGAADHEAFWELLKKGLDVHREVPSDRFDAKAHTDVTGKAKNTSITPYGCFIENPGLFDPRFFSMSPREAAQTDPMQRLALKTAYEALEMAGYVPNRTPSTMQERIGTFYGQTSDDWREINEAQDIDTYFITGGVRAFGPGRINYHFKFSGPSFSIDTACSSSMAALQLACTSLWAGDCDTAITGGLSVLTNPDIFAGLSRGQFLSKTGPCATWDNDADGYCRADGVGTLILKRLEDAQADKDNILAVILATATASNHSADAISITHHHGETQEKLYTRILHQAGIDPLDVSYVEMHGTGTQAGDGTEMRSVTNVFAPASRLRGPNQPLYLGAVKANVGHSEAASGVTALIKTLLMMQKNAIPPHRNDHIAFQETAWPRKDGEIRKVFVNNFSAAGGNSAVLLEDAPPLPELKPDPRPIHITAVSAKTKSSLRRNIERIFSYIDAHPKVSISSLAYTTTARRIQHNYRMAMPVTDIGKARDGLIAALEELISPIPSNPPKVAFAFTGQGSHYPALGKELFSHVTQFRSDLLHFDSIAQGHGLPSYLPLIDGSVDDVSSLSPIVLQLGLTCTQIALSRLWSSWGVKPDVVIGHSLGEYAALHIAGVLSVSDTIFLVGERARLLVENCRSGTHVMLATRATASSVAAIMESVHSNVEVECINAPEETVLSGLVSEIDQLCDTLSAKGIKCTKLNVPFAFHSSQVNPILTAFHSIAESVVFNEPNVPIVSPLLSVVLPSKVDATYLCRHARETVNFLGDLRSAQEAKAVDDATVWIEIGPHPVCRGFVKSTLTTPVTAAPSLRKNESPWKTFAGRLSALHKVGLNFDWNEFHRDFLDCAHLLDLPTCAFDEKNYWIDYKGNWCLTKGDNVQRIACLVPETPKLSTTTVQRIVREDFNEDGGVVVIEFNLSRPDLHAAVTGHLVQWNWSLPICKSNAMSIYADMALTVGEYLYRRLRPGTQKVDMDVCNMEVPRALIADMSGKNPQLIQLTATVDLVKGQAELAFTSGDGKHKTEHATCLVEYGDSGAWLSEWQRISYLIKPRLEVLKTAYRGMAEVILDSAELEATAHVAFQTTKADGHFFCSPFWIDSVAHLAGFIVNANDALDSKNQVYVSHGWESMRIAKPLSAEKTYQSYVKMQPAGGKMMAGDVYVFEGDEIVAVVGALKFQCIPRSLLDTLLPPAGATAVSSRKLPTAQPESRALPTTQADASKTVDTKLAGQSVIGQVLGIIATEVGIDTNELADNIEFADLGVDSLMSLAVSGRIREELKLPIHSNMFLDYPTVGQLKTFLKQYDQSTSADEEPTTSSDFTISASSTPPDSATRTPDSSQDAHSPLVVEDLGAHFNRDNGALHMTQDDIARELTCKKLLFLFPDSGGSATSYTGIPDISPDVAVFGLNSPFMKTPEEYDIGFPGIVELFLAEIRRRQSKGPYHFGGWSAGGVKAYEGCQQLIRAGEMVDTLVLIDSPCPITIEPLPSSLHRWVGSIGLLGDGDPKSIPDWLLPHFASSVTALSTYKYEKLPVGKTPNTVAIWCQDGVCKYPTDPRPDPYPYGHAQWWLENRTDFGPNRWEELMDVNKMSMTSVPGNHFTMMHGDSVRRVGDIIRDMLR
ncbi:hypothetical protein BZG36_05397 [Bifiguratus adelaidae]|uniref:Uncharacterized protein n=1 Tax=Bifiguratus adelaidae TaxID=1938954 RepID=A0A261XUB2_9FUNG|nr:hypothetical protein BZG36_05397 [Bifiguratus adelaidae]